MQTLTPTAPAPTAQETLALQVAAGNPSAFEPLMRTHHRRLFRRRALQQPSVDETALCLEISTALVKTRYFGPGGCCGWPCCTT